MIGGIIAAIYLLLPAPATLYGFAGHMVTENPTFFHSFLRKLR